MDFDPGTDVGTYSCIVTNNYGGDSHNLEIKEASKWFRKNENKNKNKNKSTICRPGVQQRGKITCRIADVVHRLTGFFYPVG